MHGDVLIRRTGTLKTASRSGNIKRKYCFKKYVNFKLVNADKLRGTVKAVANAFAPQGFALAA